MLSGWKENLRKLKGLVHGGLWDVDTESLSRGRTFLLRQGQLVMLVLRDFAADRCLLQASALTYATLLSIVPLLALMFSLLKGLGVQDTLEPIILQQLAVGSERIVAEIIGYIENTNVGRLGMAGMVTLFLTVLMLLSNIEKSFNAIWDVEETRPLFRRFADYFSVVMIGPVFILLAISMTSTLQSTAFLRALQEQAYVGEVIVLIFKVLPYVGMWIAFTALYVFMPNIKVNIRAAVIGGIFGGTLWQLAQWGYVHFQFGVARYNAIYGTMAALPILMVWIYLSWLIVLLGLEVTYASQNLRTVRREIRGVKINYSSRELAALNIMLVAGEAFVKGERSWTMTRIAAVLDLPPRLARQILLQLVRLGFLSEVNREEDDDVAYQPGRIPQKILLHEVVRALREDGVSCATRMGNTPEQDVVHELENRLDEASRQALDDLTLQDLVERVIREKKEGRTQERGEEEKRKSSVAQ